jgi:hypothetical protein
MPSIKKRNKKKTKNYNFSTAAMTNFRIIYDYIISKLKDHFHNNIYSLFLGLQFTITKKENNLHRPFLIF